MLCMGVAAVCWFFAFFVPCGNFWIKISASALCLTILAVVFGGWPLALKDLNGRATVPAKLGDFKSPLFGNHLPIPLIMFAVNCLDANPSDLPRTGYAGPVAERRFRCCFP